MMRGEHLVKLACADNNALSTEKATRVTSSSALDARQSVLMSFKVNGKCSVVDSRLQPNGGA